MFGGTGAGNKVPSGYNLGRLQNFTPDQMNLFKSLFSHVSPDSYLSKIASGDEGAFQQAEAPAYRDFNALQGNIASRFSGMGLGGRKSSGFQNTMTQAGSNFAQDLQSRRQEMQRQAIKDLLGMSGELLGQRPYEQFFSPKPPSFLSQLFGGIGSIGRGLGGLGSTFF